GIGDHSTAISLYAGIVTGLYRRERTGKGCKVTTSLIAEGAWATAAWLQAALLGAKFSGLTDRKRPENPLAGGSYQTSDNRWLLLAFVEGEKYWPVFTRAIGRDDLAARRWRGPGACSSPAEGSSPSPLPANGQPTSVPVPRFSSSSPAGASWRKSPG